MKIKNLKKDYEKITLAKARIIAHLIGDGCIYKCNHDYNIKYEVKDLESLDSFESDMLEVYGLKLTKGFKKSGFTDNLIPFLRLRSKLAYLDLLRYATYNSKDWKINDELIYASKDIKRQFLKAIFDDEGSVIKTHKKAAIRLYSINLDGLKQIQKILSEFNIESKIQPGYGLKRNVYAVIINDAHLFAKDIGFNLTRKNIKLAGLIHI